MKKFEVSNVVEMARETKLKLAVAVIITGIIAFAGLFFFLYEKEDVSTEYLHTLLEESSELTTAKLQYTGMTEYTDEGIPFINKSDFIMVYQATARAGIDLEKVEITKDRVRKVVYITVPKAEVIDVNVEPSSIKYFDEHFALFNWNQKEDANKAQAMAEEEAAKELAEMGVLEMADKQSITVIKGLVENAIPEKYVLEVKMK